MAKYNSKRIRANREFRENLIQSQNGLCPICDGAASVIDHDHETGQVRGALCGNCNLGIGYLEDNPQFLYNAIEYLIRHGKS